MEQGLPSEGLVTSCKLQEQILIQLLPSGPLSRGQEDVAPDVLVHDAAASRHTAEGHIDVFIELNGHLQMGCHRSRGLGQQAAASVLPWLGLSWLPVPVPVPALPWGLPAVCPS